MQTPSGHGDYPLETCCVPSRPVSHRPATPGMWLQHTRLLPAPTCSLFSSSKNSPSRFRSSRFLALKKMRSPGRPGMLLRDGAAAVQDKTQLTSDT